MVMDILELIEESRFRLKMNIDEYAEAIQTSKSTYQRFKKGTSDLRFQNVVAAAKLENKTLFEFLYPELEKYSAVVIKVLEEMKKNT